MEAAIAPSESVADVARTADVDASLIYRWRRELCGAKREAPAQPVGFATVPINGPQSYLTPDTVLVVELNGATLRVPAGSSARLLSIALRKLLA